MHLVVLVGVQGSGKTTWSRREYGATHLILSRDVLKTEQRESVLFHAALALHVPVVIDNTNPKRSTRQRYVRSALAAGYRCQAVFFDIDPAWALERNATRVGPARVPDPAIRGTQAKLEPPTLDEGFTDLWTVRVRAGQEDTIERTGVGDG